VAVEITAAAFSIAAVPTVAVTVMVTAQAAESLVADACLAKCVKAAVAAACPNLGIFACSAVAEVAALVKC
jgi:hypothetical protein